MTLIISKGLTLRNQLPADAEADAYIAAVEAADTAAGSPGGLESGVKFAIKNFVLCCKQDGIWDAIKASCILAGARTLSGALVPLVGTAPTNVGPFVSGDYNRKTGLQGNGSNKALRSNRLDTADPLTSKHLSVFRTAPPTLGTRTDIGTAVGSCLLWTGTSRFNRVNTGSGSVADSSNPTGFWGASRASASQVNVRIGRVSTVESSATGTQSSLSIDVFSRNIDNGGAYQNSDARLAFYSIGEALNLALLDARVTDLINAIGAAIP